MNIRLLLAVFCLVVAATPALAQTPDAVWRKDFDAWKVEHDAWTKRTNDINARREIRPPAGALDFEDGVLPAEPGLTGATGEALAMPFCAPRSKPVANRDHPAPGPRLQDAAGYLILAPFIAANAMEGAGLDRDREAGCKLLTTLTFGQPLDGEVFAGQHPRLVRYHSSRLTPDYGVLAVYLGGYAGSVIDPGPRGVWAAVGVRNGRVEWVRPGSLARLCDRRTMRPGCDAGGRYDPRS